MQGMLKRAAVAGAVWAAAAVSAAAADFDWKFFTIYGVADRQTEWMRGFADDVRQATGGRLNITVFTGSELPYKGVDVYRALSRRQIEIGHSPTGFIAADLGLLDAMSMPFVCMDMQRFFDGALPQIEATFDAAIDDKFGATPIMHWAMPGQQVWSTKAIATLEDFKGMKIRTWNQGQVQTLDKLGATSVSITTAEVTPSLQRGLIDGAITASVNADAWNWHEVLGNGYLFNITLSHEVIAVNDAALAELPEDMRAAFLEVAQKWEGTLRQEVLTLDSQARANLTAKGIKLVEPSAEDAAALATMTADIAEAWAAQQGDAGRSVLAAIRAGCQ
ncbi:TRAP transporter substrate-binding protein DctP [Ruixingdingia sedimenti]|uniref:TRAP transporter substrate-binding protein DctP n=1 Tax=Ruixingdingia sedimenti TaxID=3073604 RepID=A0ABU1F8G6_9RHOB|nr:TRAP transporter substrate-binding protein DctP [Xinfangfangia sp. LG-4]MDR5653163.1 TRAP transporter substrate-binding protein DctP [Xinfangfangia sp. LG-4]